jgi:hypothetical protein
MAGVLLPIVAFFAVLIFGFAIFSSSLGKSPVASTITLEGVNRNVSSAGVYQLAWLAECSTSCQADSQASLTAQ